MPVSAIPLQQILLTCEALYQKDGFVRWVDVAKSYGLSRQAIQLRLRRAIEAGHLDQSTYDRWESMSSRRTTTAKRRKERKQEESRLSIKCALTPDNHTWLQAECERRGCTRSDIVNGIITRARLS